MLLPKQTIKPLQSLIFSLTFQLSSILLISKPQQQCQYETSKKLSEIKPAYNNYLVVSIALEQNI